MGRRRQELAHSVTRLERDLQLHAERSERVRTSLHALASALAHEEVVARVTEYASQALGVPCALLLDAEGERAVRASTGIGRRATARLEEWAAGVGLESAFTVEDTTNVAALSELPDVGSLCAAPLRAHGEPLGVLVALAQRPYSFLPRELSILELFSEQAAIALVNARLYAAQQEMATRDPLTGLCNHREFHEVIVGEVARSRRSAAGRRPRRGDARRRPRRARRGARSQGLLHGRARARGRRHRRGRGRAGEAIPLGARIIAACDAFHAMTSDRPYRRALDLPAAADELARHSGTQFDPTVVTALLAELGSRVAPRSIAA